MIIIILTHLLRRRNGARMMRIEEVSVYAAAEYGGGKSTLHHHDHGHGVFVFIQSFSFAALGK